MVRCAVVCPLAAWFCGILPSLLEMVLLPVRCWLGGWLVALGGLSSTVRSVSRCRAAIIRWPEGGQGAALAKRSPPVLERARACSLFLRCLKGRLNDVCVCGYARPAQTAGFLTQDGLFNPKVNRLFCGKLREKTREKQHFVFFAGVDGMAFLRPYCYGP